MKMIILIGDRSFLQEILKILLDFLKILQEIYSLNKISISNRNLIQTVSSRKLRFFNRILKNSQFCSNHLNSYKMFSYSGRKFQKSYRKLVFTIKLLYQIGYFCSRKNCYGQLKNNGRFMLVPACVCGRAYVHFKHFHW